MTISSPAENFLRRLLFGMIGCVPAAIAVAQAAPPPRPAPVVIVAPPPAQQFQQTVQQQQLRDQLQQRQLEQQLHQDVSDTSKRPLAGHPRTLRQLDQADRAQQERERASQQDLLDRYRNAASLPRVVPTPLPAPARSGG